MPGRFRAAEADEAFRTIVDWLHATFGRRATPRTHVEWVFRSRISVDYDFESNERQE